MIKLLAQREQFGCAKVVSVVFRAAGEGFNGRECYRSGKGTDAAIDKQDGLGTSNIFGEFRSPLMVGDDAHIGLC